jgi:dUTP pyrophosphatase
MKKIDYTVKDSLNIKLFDGGLLPKYENNDSFLFITTNKDHLLKPKSVTLISTGIGIELKTNILMDIQLCQITNMTKNNLYMLNYPGTIDMDYRGELKVIIYNFNDYEINIRKGDKVGRLSFNKIKKIDVKSVRKDINKICS